ncbi:hypothetical protein V492_04615 [Pseudogymnoascus sp. VKM F-4246]|nr:hypothetical protein V492_04615 [Pseudogymnoascus sp. VKM F-4246]
MTAPRAERSLGVIHDKLGGMLFNTKPSTLVPHLIATTVSHSPPSTIATSTAFIGPDASQNAFCTLPLDIHKMIFDYLHDVADLICVGILTSHLWDVTQTIIQQRYRSLLGLWAGLNIVCAGQEVVAGDYPPALFSPEEVEDLNKQFFLPRHNPLLDDDEYDDDDNDMRRPYTLYNLSDRPGNRYDRPVDIVNTARKAYSACLLRSAAPDYIFRRWLSRSAIYNKFDEICVENSSFVAMDQAWILRNLTTKEIVTSEKIALDPKFIQGPFVRGIGFGEVVVSRTCWSSTANTSMSYDGNIHRGVWAGHCFDITTRERHDESTKDERGEWKDVSEEVAAEIVAIWESERGPGWRDVVIERTEKTIVEENEYRPLWRQRNTSDLRRNVRLVF